MIKAKLKAEFAMISSSIPRFFRSPGRINFIGDHTDYNDGFVMPAAINRYAYMAVGINDNEHIKLTAVDFQEYESFSLKDLKRNEEGGWTNYFIGVVSIFESRGIKISGIDCVFSSDVPVGAGLSSSAAVTCCFAFALNEILNAGFTRQELVDIAQQTEHEFAHVLCGNMDQTASVFGQKGMALMFDCRTREINSNKLELGDQSILLVDTKVKHTLADTAYNQRRKECEAGVAIIKKAYPKVINLRDVTPAMLGTVILSKTVNNRCSFVIEENLRVQSAAFCLEENDLNSFGMQMWASHEGLSKQYEVSCAELDFIVDQARSSGYVLGARMMGGGFGGCCILLIENRKIEIFKNSLTDTFKKNFGTNPEFYEFETSDGTSEMI